MVNSSSRTVQKYRPTSNLHLLPSEGHTIRICSYKVYFENSPLHEGRPHQHSLNYVLQKEDTGTEKAHREKGVNCQLHTFIRLHKVRAPSNQICRRTQSLLNHVTLYYESPILSNITKMLKENDHEEDGI